MPRTVAVLVNPEARSGRALRGARDLISELARTGHRVEMLVGRDAADSERLARNAVVAGVSALVAAGGDGTLSIALQAVADTGTPLGIAALGTANDTARGLGLPVNDGRAAAAVIARWLPRAIDAGLAVTGDGTRRWFLGVLSAGFDARVNERSSRVRWPRGRLRYLAALAAELPRYGPVDFAMEIDGEPYDGPTVFVAVGNGTRYGGGMRICEGAQVDDGQLTMTWVHGIGLASFATAMPRVFWGGHLGHPAVTQHHGRDFRLSAPRQIAYADGERVGPLPIDVVARPAALTVLLPATATVGTRVAQGPVA